MAETLKLFMREKYHLIYIVKKQAHTSRTARTAISERLFGWKKTGECSFRSFHVK